MAEADNESDISFESADEGDLPTADSEMSPPVDKNRENERKEREEKTEEGDPKGNLEGDNDDTPKAAANAQMKEVSLDSTGENPSNSANSSKLEIQQESDKRTETESSTEIESKSKKEVESVKETKTIPTNTSQEKGKDNVTSSELENTDTESKDLTYSPANQSIERNTTDGRETGASDKSETATNQGSWGSWGGGWSGWGSSLLTSATATVSAVSGSVGKVIENVESSLGVPKPGDLPKASDDESKAEAQGEVAEQNSEEPTAATSPGGTVGSFFSYGASALTTVVGKTVSGGLDALEVIGKKTMDVIQEGDPGLRKTREYFKGRKDGHNLSELLREAKREADERALLQEEEDERQRCHFGWLFEQNQGLAHLEALEILSNESETRVESVVGGTEEDSMNDLKTELMEIKDAFELEDIESEEADESGDFVNTITEHLFSLSVAATPDKLKRVQSDAHQWLSKLENDDSEGDTANVPDAKEVHQKAMQVLADLTARSIEQFHKTGELLLLKQVTEENKSPIQQATSLSKLTSALCAEVSFVASKFSEKLSRMAPSSTDPETVNGYVTNIFLEASNSTSYIQDAFQLLLPVMQVVAIELKQNP